MAALCRSVLSSSKENLPPSPSPHERNASPQVLHSLSKQRMAGGKIATMRDHWDEQVQRRAHPDFHKESPTLTLLKSTSRTSQEEKKARGSVYTKQRALDKMHHAAKSRLEGVSGLGGGVSLWPAMDDMRLSRSDAVQLSCTSLVLMIATGIIFATYHGVHVSKMKYYSEALGRFPSTHPLSVDRGQELFDSQVLLWHTDLLEVQNTIHTDFNVTWSATSVLDISSMALYMSGIGTLLYFLAENVFSKNRLTPRRIKLWVSLLCVMTSWSILSVYLLVCAQRLEASMENTVFSLSNQLAELVLTDLDLSRYHSVLLYWQTQYLHPMSRGLLSVMGVCSVKDMSYYLHYYSLHIITALCTPIVKLIISIKTVYNW